MKKPLTFALILPALIVTSDRRTRRQQAERRRLTHFYALRWWVHSRINTRADDQPGQLAACAADPMNKADFAALLRHTRELRNA